MPEETSYKIFLFQLISACQGFKLVIDRNQNWFSLVQAARTTAGTSNSLTWIHSSLQEPILVLLRRVTRTSLCESRFLCIWILACQHYCALSTEGDYYLLDLHQVLVDRGLPLHHVLHQHMEQVHLLDLVGQVDPGVQNH